MPPQTQRKQRDPKDHVAISAMSSQELVALPKEPLALTLTLIFERMSKLMKTDVYSTQNSASIAR
jgi:hypothetical protein